MLSCFRGLSAKIITVPLAAFTLGLLVPGILGYQLLQHGAYRETHDKAVATNALIAAVRRSAEDTAAPRAGAGRNDIAHRGTQAAMQAVKQYQSSWHEDTFQYRRVALNPVEPKDRADGFEAGLVRLLAANPRLAQTEQEIRDKGVTYHVLATPITVSQERCLSCHGASKEASASRVKRYGHRAATGWKLRQVVGADIIYTPSDYPRSQAAAAFWAVTRSVAVLALICSIMLILRAHYLVARPVREMLATSEAIQRGEWPRRPVRYSGDELGALASSFHATTLNLRNRVVHEEKLRALFQQFIPASIAATALGKNAEEVMVGTRHPVTVMIINIRNFKLLMDHLPPDQTVATLNEYFAGVNRVIVANRGLVSKYMGDSVMALFGMPLGHENHGLCAVRAALAIPAALQDLYVRLDEQYGWELGVGVGISTGEPIIGSFGSSEHLEYSVLGDVVAEASHLEAATKAVPEEDSILISEATYRCVMSEVHVLDLGKKPAGNGKEIHAYVVQGLRAEVRSSLAA